MKKSKIYIAVISLLIMMVISTGCGGSQKVTFVLDWTPNTNHTGVYVALEKGIMRRKALMWRSYSLRIWVLIHGGLRNCPVWDQLSGERHLCPRRKCPLVSIAAVIQHNTSGFERSKKKYQRPGRF